MAETSVHLPARSGRTALRRWLIGAVAATVLAGAGTGIALSLTGGSPSTGQTPAVVSTWLQGHPDMAAWMRDHPGEWTWMRQHWSDMQWMRGHWSGMAWVHDHPGVTGGSGMMGSMPAGSLAEMRQWMAGNAGTWAWMQAHWSSMSFWMRAHWSDMQ
jgi:hypothetical protein